MSPRSSAFEPSPGLKRCLIACLLLFPIAARSSTPASSSKISELAAVAVASAAGFIGSAMPARSGDRERERDRRGAGRLKESARFCSSGLLRRPGHGQCGQRRSATPSLLLAPEVLKKPSTTKARARPFRRAHRRHVHGRSTPEDADSEDAVRMAGGIRERRPGSTERFHAMAGGHLRPGRQ